MHNESNDSLKEALDYFKNHASIVNIQRKCFDTSFSSRETNSNEFIKLIKTLNMNKDWQNTCISTKIIMSNTDLFVNYRFIKFQLLSWKKVNHFMCLNMLMLYLFIIEKKKKKTKQIIDLWISSSVNLKFMQINLSTIVWSFRFYSFTKTMWFLYRSQWRHCFMVKESMDRGEALFTDLSNSFHCIDHNLLIIKLSW